MQSGIEAKAQKERIVSSNVYSARLLGRNLKSAKIKKGLKKQIPTSQPVLDEYDELGIKEDLDEDDSFYDKVDQQIYQDLQ